MSTPGSNPGGIAERAVLNTGARMPLLGLGTWKIPKAQCPELVRVAVEETGWRHLDCACDYGNEKEVGDGIAASLASGACAREDLWVTSKLWNTYHRKEHVRAACKRSLDDLGLEYLDLYLMHFPISLAFVPFETRYPPEWVHDPDAAAGPALHARHTRHRYQVKECVFWLVVAIEFFFGNKHPRELRLDSSFF